MLNVYDFMKDLPASKRLVVNDLLFADYKCPLSETRYDMWTHHNYFVYVMKGKKKWFSKDGEVLARAGDCIFVKKGAHSIYQYFDDEFCSLFMFVPDLFIRDTLLDNRVKLSSDNQKGNISPILRVGVNEMLKAYFLSLLSYITNTDSSYKKLAEMKFRELILIIATGSGNSEVTHYFSSLCNTSRPSLQSVMESNFNYPMSLEEYARLSGRSLSTFKRDFKEIYSTTPGRWLTQKRLEYGRYLLDQTGKSVTEVVLDCGFKNLSHFSRTYKKKFGTAPLRHKKTSKQKV
jgi:AraC family transcriptional regulator, exoenzyme S synthesis regulatory protein ExsA